MKQDLRPQDCQVAGQGPTPQCEGPVRAREAIYPASTSHTVQGPALHPKPKAQGSPRKPVIQKMKEKEGDCQRRDGKGLGIHILVTARVASMHRV